MKYVIPTIALTSILLTACSPSGTPMVDMCKKITQNRIGSITGWEDPQKSERRKSMLISIGYTTEGGENGSTDCSFPRMGEEDFRTSPSEVAINGVELEQKELMAASLDSSKEVMDETVAETKERAAEAADKAEQMAGEAKVKATEMAADAKVKAGELADKAEVLAADAKVKASELAGQASELADNAADKARELTIEAAKTVQEKLENQ